MTNDSIDLDYQRPSNFNSACELRIILLQLLLYSCRWQLLTLMMLVHLYESDQQQNTNLLSSLDHFPSLKSF